MKKVLIVLLLVLVTCQAWAEDDGETKNFGVSIGVKAWYMDWSSWTDHQRGSNITLDADSEFTFIPALTVRYKNIFLNGSYVLPTEFSFYEYDEMYNIGGSPTLGTLKYEGERSEYDINLGYMLTPGLAVTVGWKDIQQDFSFTNDIYTNPSTFSWNMSGPTVGVAGNAMMSENLGMYGNLGYGLLTTERYDSDVEYLSYELGLVLIPTPKFNVTLGYKSQFVDSEQVSSTTTETGHDVTRGILLGANFSF